MGNFSVLIHPHDRIILAIREHIGTEEAVGVGGGEGVGVDEPADGRIIVAALEVVEARLAVVVITTVAQWVDVPDEGGIRGLFAVSTMHGVVAPRAVGAAAQRNAADNDDDLWLCADGCTHHSDHLSISLRAVLLHRPLAESPIFRVTGWNFSLFCRSIRNLDTVSTMIKIFCRIVAQISVFHRKHVTMMRVKPFSFILHLSVPIIYNPIRQVAECLSGHVENLICLRREKIAFVYLNSSIYVIPANVYCTCIVSIIYLHTQRHSCIVQDILL